MKLPVLLLPCFSSECLRWRRPMRPAKEWPSQEACEQGTGKKCDFVMCDYLPEGKTLEEVCGKDFKKGWQPVLEPVPTPEHGKQ